MARRMSGNGALLVVIVVAAIIATVPSEIWIALVLILGVVTALYLAANQFKRVSKPSEDFGPTLEELTAKSAKTRRNVAPPPLRQGPPAQTRPVTQRAKTQAASRPDDELVRPVVRKVDTTERSHPIPKAPDGFGKVRWVKPSETVNVAGVLLTGGGFYFGRSATSTGNVEPSLIDPTLAVSKQGDFTESQTDYWPSYTRIGPSARRAYLDWLSSGRNHPDCDIGFVFLYFYGLERRVIVDAGASPALQDEWPAIASELRRLLAIYGAASGSFRRYAGELLDWIELSSVEDTLYRKPLPEFPQSHELPSYLRLALGQAAVDRAPVPAALALAWAQLSPNVYLRMPATRCPHEFATLFALRYHEALGSGMALPKNRTKLKFVYQPASSALHGARGLTKTFGDIPDVTVLTGPLKKLQDVVNRCTDDLSAFSRAVGKDSDAGTKLDGLIHLPPVLWPQSARDRIESLRASMKNGRATHTFDGILSALGGMEQSPTRDRVASLANTLEAFHIGMEPNVLLGARTPVGAAPVVIFALPAEKAPQRDAASYQVALLTLQLASAVARADGVFSDDEVSHLQTEIDHWVHLSSGEIVRLHAHLDWLRTVPVTLASLKTKLEPLPGATREAIATSMATLTQADGQVSPDEVKFLEKVYKALGVDAKRVFSDVHAGSTAGQRPSATPTTGFKLDRKRIEALQQDTERVSALLADIFKEEDVASPAMIEAAVASDIEAVDDAGCLWGLDEAHSALVRLLLSRPSWERSELEDAAADLNLMLDGALERINDASYDVNDLPLTEGDDPLEISADVAEMIEA